MDLDIVNDTETPVQDRAARTNTPAHVEEVERCKVTHGNPQMQLWVTMIVQCCPCIINTYGKINDYGIYVK